MRRVKVVGLAGAAREIFHSFENTFLKLIERTFGLAGKDLAQARNTKELLIGVHRFGDAVAEEYDRVAGLEFQARHRVFGFGNQPNGIRALAEGVFGHAMANQERRRMTGIDVFEVALLVQNSEKHRGVAADFGVIAQKAIDVIEDACRIGAESHAGERALEHGGEKRGAESFAGNVGDQESGAVIVERENVEVIATDGRGTGN